MVVVEGNKVAWSWRWGIIESKFGEGKGDLPITSSSLAPSPNPSRLPAKGLGL
jgi:hypothetical protein